MPCWSAKRIVRQEKPAQSDRLWFGIVEFDEIRGEKRELVGQPLVDLELVKVPGRLGCVGCPKGGLREHKCAAVHPADRKVRQLDPEDHRVKKPAAVRRFVKEIDVVAAGFEAETEVNARCAVVVVGVEQQILSGAEQCVWRENEFARVARVLGDA